MTIGPAPMIRIEEMSVRLGMLLDIRARHRHKKRARSLRVLRAAQRLRPRARALFRPESAGREERPQNNGVKTGRRDDIGRSRPPRDEGHARAVVADIGGSAGRPKTPRGGPGGHPPPPLTREARIEAPPPASRGER